MEQNLVMEIEMRREQVAECRRMCRERFPHQGAPWGWLAQSYAYHQCVKLLHEAEELLRASERKLESHTNGAP